MELAANYIWDDLYAIHRKYAVFVYSFPKPFLIISQLQFLFPFSVEVEPTFQCQLIPPEKFEIRIPDSIIHVF